MRSNSIDKIPNTNTQIINSQSAYGLNSYNLRTKKTIFISPKFIKKLSEDLIDWTLKQTTAVGIQHFLNEKGYSSCGYYKWLDKFEDLKAIHNDCIAYLGAVRETEATYNKNCNYQVILVTLPMYSHEFRKAAELQAELKAKAQTAQQTNVVVGIPTYQYDVIPSCAEAPAGKPVSQQPGIPVDKAEEK